MKTKFSQVGFVLAAAGSAVGLGNVWKFPYMTGENGGGAFVLIYLLTIVSIGVTIFIAEVIMGRLSEGDTVTAFETLTPKFGKYWKFAGIIAATPILIVSFYMVVIGWLFKYIYVIAMNMPKNIEESGAVFGNMVTADIGGQFLFFTIAFAIVFSIVLGGIKHGIERINLWLMPALFMILLLMLFYSFSMTGFGKAMEFLFVPDWSKINSTAILAALGQAFFTLSLGVGTIMTYAASLPRDSNIVKSSLYVAIMDTVVAVVAGIIIFTFIFHFNTEPSQGPGLVFISLPTLFYQLDFVGVILGVMFFIALAFAGITSAISMIEPATFFLIRRFKMSRLKSLIILGIIVYILGSLSLLSNINDLKEGLTFFGKGFFDILDFLTSSILMPLGGIAIAVYVGFFMKKEGIKVLLLPYMSSRLLNLWYFILKFIAPVAVLIVMINMLLG